MLSWTRQIVKVTGVPTTGMTMTVLMRGSNRLVLDEAERSVHDALCVVRSLVSRGCFPLCVVCLFEHEALASFQRFGRGDVLLDNVFPLLLLLLLLLLLQPVFLFIQVGARAPFMCQMFM